MATTVAGVDVLTIVNNVRFIKYAAGPRRGVNLVTPFMHGRRYVPDKYFDEADVLMEVVLPGDTDAAGKTALSALQLLFASQDLVTVAQDDPYAGAIQARCELLTEPIPTQNRLVYMFPLTNPSGFWEDQTATTAASASPPSVTTGGDRPVGDMVLTFAGVGYLEHTDSLGQLSRLTIDAAAGAGSYVVDCGARSVKKAGVDQDEFLTYSQPWWMKWQPDTVQSFTSSVAVAASWKNKWA